mmetsp:Transcript_94428/g.177778  ORF Transcript_94428/g.177778 Transcript_94428/m.177778 type:complete len:149 (+) Transcript_94428:73-519(+)
MADNLAEVIQLYTPDVINLYYAFIFNLILWLGVWLLSFAKDPNPIAAIVLAIGFVFFFPREWLQALHDHDHLQQLPGYPFTLILLALGLSAAPWPLIVVPALNKQDIKVKAENEEIQATVDATCTEGGRKCEDANIDGLRQRNVRGAL